MSNEYGYHRNYPHHSYGKPAFSPSPAYTNIKCCVYRNESDLSQPLSYNCVYSDTYCPPNIGVWVKINEYAVSDCYYCSQHTINHK